jgi:hypothetical protein
MYDLTSPGSGHRRRRSCSGDAATRWILPLAPAPPQERSRASPKASLLLPVRCSSLGQSDRAARDGCSGTGAELSAEPQQVAAMLLVSFRRDVDFCDDFAFRLFCSAPKQERAPARVSGFVWSPARGRLTSPRTTPSP